MTAYLRVHFAKTQVQLPLEQNSSIPRVHGTTPPFPSPKVGEEGGRAEGEGGWRGL